MTRAFRYSMCNEAFEKWPFADACKSLRKAGHTGIEIAPFTLGEDPALVTAAQRRAYRDIMESEGLSLTHVWSLIDLCADLGPDGVLVFGSPAQRASTGGLTREQATRNFVEGLAAMAPHARERGATILLEALPANQCDVVQTLDEAAAIVREIGSPFVQTMFDVHNAIDEVEPHAALVERHFESIRHVHVNELDGRHYGAGDSYFPPLLDVLRRRAYAGWISLEVFDFTPGPERIAAESLRHLESESARRSEERR